MSDDDHSDDPPVKAVIAGLIFLILGLYLAGDRIYERGQDAALADRLRREGVQVDALSIRRTEDKSRVSWTIRYDFRNEPHGVTLYCNPTFEDCPINETSVLIDPQDPGKFLTPEGLVGGRPYRRGDIPTMVIGSVMAVIGAVGIVMTIKTARNPGARRKTKKRKRQRPRRV